MADEDLLRKIHGLGDLDLAALLCLINREHCIISTEPEALDDLVDELQLVATETFNLKPTVVSLGPQSTLDDFAASILLPTPASRSSSPLRTRTPVSDSYFHPSHASLHPGSGGGTNTHHRTLSPLTQLSPGSAATPGGQSSAYVPAPQIANVVLARDLDKAPKAVQIQALELLRTRRIFTRTSVQTAPKQFLFVAVLGAPSGGDARLTQHLNDFFYVAHWHDPLDGFAHLEEREAALQEDDDDASLNADADVDTDSLRSDRSVVRRPSRTSRASTPGNELLTPGSAAGRGITSYEGGAAEPVITEADITTVSLASCSVSVDVDVLRYQMNLVSFLRMHHAVGGGVGPVATQHLDALVRSMAVLHGLDYATPALVALALRKVYLHRIRIIRDPAVERSVQWGSDVAAVERMLEGVGPEEVMDDVLEMVDVPL
ncbi:uncharacterized protein JN550_008885 [Neoarthrinium moseri]|uniref:uncharacterized protein n=1 Tax=Neoarthrinium moseri TaxID=1658444 RepID=UPI001FDE227D|nr:uncharacterized protein JN550_008885 [Neoarthrinium moseri]KAI1864598.1 hypothetical protein JN550_008885 [Neoarthrinium moseri]